MKLGRRMFASLMPAAPVMAGEIGRGVADNLSSYTTTNPVPLGMGEIVNRFDPPATYKKYREVENTLWKVRYFRHTRNEIAGSLRHIDANIMALKSVSIQHKAIMHMKQEEQEVERNRTFLEQLQDTLGLREYFKKHNDLEGPQTASSAGW